MAVKEEKFGPMFVRHAKCGGEYQVFAPDEMVPDSVDCQICREIRERFGVSYGLNNTATAGTPLPQNWAWWSWWIKSGRSPVSVRFERYFSEAFQKIGAINQGEKEVFR